MRRLLLKATGRALLVPGLALLGLCASEARDAPEANVVSVRIDAPGATPEEIERQLAVPLEERLAKIDGVRSVTSRSDDGKLLLEVRFHRSATDADLRRVTPFALEVGANASIKAGPPRLSLQRGSVR